VLEAGTRIAAASVSRPTQHVAPSFHIVICYYPPSTVLPIGAHGRYIWHRFANSAAVLLLVNIETDIRQKQTQIVSYSYV